MVAILNEFMFDEGDTIEEFYDKSVVARLRKEYDNKCYDLANLLKRELNTAGVLAEVVTFKNGNSLATELKVKNELENKVETYNYHSVVLLGNCVVDLLHTDRLISTKEYVGNLSKLNKNLRLDYLMGGFWYSDDGHKIQVNVDSLLKM